MQGMMYCLGNKPVFPASFPYEEYYYILFLECDGELIKICRKGEGSDHIAYESADSEFSFDISTVGMKTQILESVQEKVEIYSEEIGRLTSEINICQKERDLSELKEQLETKDAISKDLVKQTDVKLEQILEQISEHEEVILKILMHSTKYWK